MNIPDLLHDAVDDVEPADRIVEIRARTATSQQAAARPWFYAAGGVVLATAAAVTAFAVLGNDAPPDSHHDHHMATDPMDTQLVAAYFVGDTPDGPRLYREFDRVPAGDPLQGALDRIQRPPSDPDYRTSWPHDALRSARVNDGVIEVEIGDAEWSLDDLDAQQLVYTLQAAAGERLPVRLVREGYGEPIGRPLEAAPENDVLAPVSISDPAEGNSYSGSMIARGRANSFESTIAWELRDDAGEVVAHGSTTADGNGDRLYPWQVEIDLAGVPFGFYTFVAMTDDPVVDGVGPTTDTRLITVR